AVAAGVALAALAQLGVAAAMVLTALPTGLRLVHLALGTAIWVGLVALAELLDARPGAPAPAAGRVRAIAADLLALTKPRIVALLLVTTVVPMLVAGPELPPASLVAWTAIAGYLMAGGANAVNMWFDRDIDGRMRRTRLRPVPAGRIGPRGALAFGLALAAVAFALFWTRVNPLAAWLAAAGFVYYVLVYTIWLKRRTPLNIVVGGAAGAFPPLVGWAAAAGRLDLAALYLFAVVFYWTPPHFWALALVKRDEYAHAGVPMLPVVRGERETKWQMLLYAVMLLPLTLVPPLTGAAGLLYGVAALALGLRLIWYCGRLLGEAGATPTAWRLYRFSLLYLALLFTALAVDRALPVGRLEASAGPALVLRDPVGGPPAAGAA
ncbi:MAG TPA: heme o synthase, partial [Thermodesulfobacteriota bacterium]|nr:heme o synthase [Thermodesulfobacteriota bacterium]